MEIKVCSELIKISAKDITKKFKLISREGFKNKHSMLIIENLSNIEIIIRYEKNKKTMFYLRPNENIMYDCNLSKPSKYYFSLGTRLKIKHINYNDNFVLNGYISINALIEM